VAGMGRRGGWGAGRMECWVDGVLSVWCEDDGGGAGGGGGLTFSSGHAILDTVYCIQYANHPSDCSRRHTPHRGPRIDPEAVKTLRDRIADRIRSLIIDGRITPGERLVEPTSPGSLA